MAPPTSRAIRYHRAEETMKLDIQAIGFVEASRQEAEDDYWGGAESCVVLDEQQFESQALQGLEDFSHVEILFFFDRGWSLISPS